MADKQVIVEVVEVPKGLPRAQEENPELRMGVQAEKEKLWASAQERAYEVVRLVNTVDYEIGEILSRQDVKELCAQAGWKVVVKSKK